MTDKILKEEKTQVKVKFSGQSGGISACGQKKLVEKSRKTVSLSKIEPKATDNWKKSFRI